jgi:hypothetical protein
MVVVLVPIIHDFCLPPRKAFSVVLEEATSRSVRSGGPSGGLVRMFGECYLASDLEAREAIAFQSWVLSRTRPGTD